MRTGNKIIGCFLFLTLVVVLAWSCQDEEFVPLRIDLVSPGAVLIGDTITLEGQGFSPDYATNRIYFNGIKSYASPGKGSTLNRLLVAIPDSATSGTIRVNILDDEIFDSPPVTIKTPVFESIAPNTGYVGDTIVISGENFRSDGNNNHVRFPKIQGDAVFGEVIASTGSELHVIVPEGAKPGNLSVLGFQGPKFNFKVGKITGVSPTRGFVGDTITITGVGFIPDETTIYFNQGVPAISTWEGLENTSREMRAIVPADTRNGKIRMAIRMGQKEFAVLSDSVFQIFPSIKGLSSTVGPPGYLLSITGYGFMPKNSPGSNIVVATINDIPAPVENMDNQNIVVRVPANATSGKVKVSINGRIAIGPEFQLTAAGIPIVERLSKNSGFVGDEIKIYGQYFSSQIEGNVVKFGSITALVTAATATELTVTVPVGAVTGKINVSSNGVPALNAPDFTVKQQVIDFEIESVTPASLLQAQDITITGKNFSTAGDIAVYITQAFSPGVSYELWDDYTSIINSTRITARIESFNDPANGFQRIIYPPGDYNVTIRYKSTPEEDASNKKTITIQGPPPNIQSISPSENYVGEIVTLSGSYFDGTDINNVVKFDDVPATIVTPDDGNPATVRVIVPSITEGTHNVTITVKGKNSSPFPFTILKKVAATITPKPVYYLGRNGSAITLSKVTTESTSPLQIFTTNSTTDGITSMVVDLRADLASSLIYFSQFSFGQKDEDGIFSMKLNGTSKKRIVTTAPPDPDSGSPGDGINVSDMSLDVTSERLYWSENSTFKVLTSKTNDNPIKVPQMVTQLDVSRYYLMAGLSYSNGKVYYVGFFDDDIGNTQSEVFKVDIVTKGVTKIINAGQKLGIVHDLKIDEAAGEIYMLIEDSNGDYSYQVSKADLDGKNLETLLDFEGDTQVLGISLDLEDSFIYWLQEKGGNQTIGLARMDGGDIGDQPGVKRQIAYENLSFNLGGSRTGSIAVEAPGGGAAGRLGSVSMQLKFRVKKPR